MAQSIYDRSYLRPGRVRITCDDPREDLYFWMGDDTVKYTGGFGGWELTDRPEQMSMTTWNGIEPLQLQLPLMIAWWFDIGESVQAQVSRLITLARGDTESPPGIVTVWGLPLGARRWVIENLDFGDPLLRPSDGHPVRQPVTVTLRQYVPPSLMRIKRGARDAPKGKTRTITVKHGDTPAKIARRVKCKWTDLRELNPKAVRKANQALKASIRLRVPVAAPHKHHAHHRH